MICGAGGGGGGVTCTVAVCGELLPPAPVATAEYMVVCVGESVTVPDAWALVVTVRVEDPAAAVIVTDVAFVLCQLSVTLCPVSIDAGLTTRLMVGFAGGGGGVLARPAQPLKPAIATDRHPKTMQRKWVLFILCVFRAA